MFLYIMKILMTMVTNKNLKKKKKNNDPNDPAYHDEPHHDASLYSSLAAQRSRRSQRPCISRRSPSRCQPLLISRCSAISTIPTTLQIPTILITMPTLLFIANKNKIPFPNEDKRLPNFSEPSRGLFQTTQKTS